MITLVGAGPVGALWSIFLKQKGHEVRVFEKRPDPRLAKNQAGRSINLIITSRGLNALKKAGLSPLVPQITKPVYGRMIHSKTGDQVYQAYGQKGECNYSVSRAEINNTLITEAEKIGVNFFFEHELQNLTPETKNIVFNYKNETKSFDYDVLFASDGAGSRVRKSLTQINQDFNEQIDRLEADYKELTLPLDSNKKAQLNTEALHIWPRGAHMMMALVNLDNSFTLTVYLPRQSDLKRMPWGFDLLTDDKKISEFFKSEFADALPLMPDYLYEFKNNPQGHLATVRFNKWVYNDSICLMGDAAHAIVPFFGQGMNCGFEDCTTLLDLYEKHAGRWSEVLPSFEKIQKPNADAIADMALENWTEMRDKVGDSNFLLRKKIEAAIEEKYPNVFKSRYGLITYTLTPYQICQKAGHVQNEMIDEILKEAESVDSISWQQVESLIQGKWMKFFVENNLENSISKFAL